MYMIKFIFFSIICIYNLIKNLIYKINTSLGAVHFYKFLIDNNLTARTFEII